MAIAGYIYRYPLLMKFQYSRLQSLTCREQSYNRKFNCQGKIWVHRVNSLERYELLKNKFAGFEADLSFHPEKGTFFVYHPPLTSKTDVMPLSTFLDHVDLHRNGFWFDTRYVGISNAEQAIQALADLDTLTIKMLCTFEFYDAKAAAFFSQRGYHTSFNASEEILQQAEKDSRYRDSINRIIAGVTFVSQDISYLPVLKKIFPGKQIVTWDLHFGSFINRSRLQELLNDRRVAFIFVNIKTPFYR